MGMLKLSIWFVQNVEKNAMLRYRIGGLLRVKIMAKKQNKKKRHIYTPIISIKLECDYCMARYLETRSRCPHCKQPNPDYKERVFNLF